MEEPEILFEQRGRLGLITLNRPKALNALTYGMVRALDAQLDVWAGDDSIEVVAIRGAGDKAFAAGGDIRWLYENGQGGRTGERNFDFFWDEYRLNTKIKRYPKPYVGIMDGVIMGGGVGVSIHGSLRIATERTVFAMPETGIGLFPDVGGTYFLPRLPGEIGMWLGLTGARLRGRDVVAAGICDVFLGTSDIETLLKCLADGRIDSSDPSEVVDDPHDLFQPHMTDDPGQGLPHRHLLDDAFGSASVEEVIAQLVEFQTEWAAKQRVTIRSKSPTSTRIAFRQIREGASLSFEDCMRLEYRLARYCMTHPDFYEGVRAVIIDKDNAPRWSPATLAEASEDHVAEAFADLGGEELQFS